MIFFAHHHERSAGGRICSVVFAVCVAAIRVLPVNGAVRYVEQVSVAAVSFGESFLSWFIENVFLRPEKSVWARRDFSDAFGRSPDFRFLKIICVRRGNDDCCGFELLLSAEGEI